MNREMKKIALAAAIVLLAGTVKADPLGWTGIGIAYDRADAGDQSTDAFDVQGSLGFAGIGHVQLTYINGSTDNGEGGSFDFDGYDVRAGIHPSVGENTQAVVEAAYFNYSGDLGTGSDGWGVGFGVRHKIGDQFEVRGQVDYYNGSFDGGSLTTNSDFDDTTFTVGGRYYWMPSLFTGISMALDRGEVVPIAGASADVLRVDVGWSFGGDVM